MLLISVVIGNDSNKNEYDWAIDKEKKKKRLPFKKKKKKRLNTFFTDVLSRDLMNDMWYDILYNGEDIHILIVCELIWGKTKYRSEGN